MASVTSKSKVYTMRVDGVEITFRCREESRYVIVTLPSQGGHLVSQHTTAAATYREWVRLNRQHFIFARDRAAYDEIVAEHPDAVAVGYGESEFES